MEISIEAVKELRDQSRAGIMACRSALLEAQGDMEKALELLKQQSLVLVKKKEETKADEKPAEEKKEETKEEKPEEKAVEEKKETPKEEPKKEEAKPTEKPVEEKKD